MSIDVKKGVAYSQVGLEAVPQSAHVRAVRADRQLREQERLHVRLVQRRELRPQNLREADDGLVDCHE